MLIKAKCVLGIRDKNGTGPIYPGCIADVDDREAKRLIAQGVAESVARPAAVGTGKAAPADKAGENPSEDENAQNGALNPENEITETEDLGKLEDMSFNELKQIAKDLGIETGKIKSKAGMIAAISDVATGIPADEEPPVFEAQEVVE